MKIMSGYVSKKILFDYLSIYIQNTYQDTRQTPDYSQKFEDELHKIQDKTILLYEMLETVRPGENIERNETIMVSTYKIASEGFMFILCVCLGLKKFLCKCPTKIAKNDN